MDAEQIEQVKQMAIDVNNVAAAAFRSGQKPLLVKIKKLEEKLKKTEEFKKALMSLHPGYSMDFPFSPVPVCPAQAARHLQGKLNDLDELLSLGIDGLIDQLAKDLGFDALKDWCDVLSIDYELPPMDDMWPDWEVELRSKVGDSMRKLSN